MGILKLRSVDTCSVSCGDKGAWVSYFFNETIQTEKYVIHLLDAGDSDYPLDFAEKLWLREENSPVVRLKHHDLQSEGDVEIDVRLQDVVRNEKYVKLFWEKIENDV